jgi:CheY-like chemotaxis protein
VIKGLTAPEQAPRAAEPARPPLVLVVDDSADIRELLRLHLGDAGYRVVTAEDAVAAGHCVARELPNLIIADFKMPYMNGVEFIAALRADATIPDIPVIFITDTDASAELTGRTFGFPLLTKPVLADKLLATVATQLAGGRR